MRGTGKEKGVEDIQLWWRPCVVQREEVCRREAEFGAFWSPWGLLFNGKLEHRPQLVSSAFYSSELRAALRLDRFLSFHGILQRLSEFSVLLVFSSIIPPWGYKSTSAQAAAMTPETGRFGFRGLRLRVFCCFGYVFEVMVSGIRCQFKRLVQGLVTGTKDLGIGIQQGLQIGSTQPPQKPETLTLKP